MHPKTRSGSPSRSVSFITLGCAKNEVDSEDMARRLIAAGYGISADPEKADVVIVNTCSFIQAATEESIDAILEVAGFESVASGNAHLVVSGCMPSRYGDELSAELPEASGFVPCANEEDIVGVIDGLFGIERIPGENRAVQTSFKTNRISAYVKISDGCNRFCSYCTIPFIRGRYRSFDEDAIFADVRQAVVEGAREVVFIAQDTGRWGTDFETPSTLADLLSHVAESWPAVWFRVLYIQPEGITDRLIDAVSRHGNVCSYFDIPFQHSNERILEAMNRKGSMRENLDLIERIRAKIPDATIRTTLIAGFPGETERDFEELCEFVEIAGFDYVGVFPYSREDGTRAAALDDQIDEDDKLFRAQRLRDLSDAVCAQRIAQRVGNVEDVLVCGYEEDGQLYGRCKSQAPDVDGVTYIDSGTPGDFVRVRIDDTLLYEMEGEVLF